MYGAVQARPPAFDCSGFVCWVFTNSGVHNLPRTTAQGIYDQCTPVSAADAKAGDIIFLQALTTRRGLVSHVGIYCGNGTVMIHCGDPIKYASINTSYWQSHFMPSAEYQEIKCLMIIKFDTMIIKTDIFIKKE